MIEVAELARYPLTGAQAEHLEKTLMTAAGIACDRVLVLYDSTADSTVKPRQSQKEHHGLAAIQATTSVNGTEITFPGGQTDEVQFKLQGESIRVDEFGTVTPAYDMGDYWAERFADHFDTDGLRLALKSHFWRLGYGLNPRDRSNRPVHIVSTASVDYLKSLGENADFDASRFRPNIVLSGDLEPFGENDWIGQTIRIGGVLYTILKHTQRCPVPGIDQETGENRKDVPKLYKHLPTNEKGRPVFGVYGFPLLHGTGMMPIAVGDMVTLPNAA